jgi:hypothetical protein
MSQIKISELPQAGLTTGNELLAMVQDGITKKQSVNELNLAKNTDIVTLGQIIDGQQAEIDAVELLAAANTVAITGVQSAAGTLSVELAVAEARIVELESVLAAVNDPTGFRRDIDTTAHMGILEYSPDGTTIYRIDNNMVFSKTTSGLYAEGTPYEVAATANTSCIYPTSVNDPIEVWLAGRKYLYTTLQQKDVCPNAGDFSISYFDEEGFKCTLGNGTIGTRTVFSKYAAVALIYAPNSNKYIFADERHGIRMDGETHGWLHRHQGTQIFSGADIIGLASGSPTFTQIDSGVFYDEDIRFAVAARTTQPFFYRTGAADWVLTATPNNEIRMRGVNNYTQYNQDVGGVWQLTELGANQFCLYHFYFSNDSEYSYIKLPGVTSYAGVANARNAATKEAQSIKFSFLPTPEFKLLYSVIVDRAGNLVLNEDGETHVDFRRTTI